MKVTAFLCYLYITLSLKLASGVMPISAKCLSTDLLSAGPIMRIFKTLQRPNEQKLYHVRIREFSSVLLQTQEVLE